jgi:dCMP deaminase
VRPSWDATWMLVAHQVAQRSLCTRAQCGAVIVTTDNRVIATGYNGPPAGFQRVHNAAGPESPQLCDQWCPRAHPDRVYDPAETDVQMRTEVYWSQGAGKVAAAERVAAEMTEWSRQRDPSYDDCPSLHAEANALIAADRSTWQGGTIYVTGSCCMTCSKLIANSGLTRLVWQEETVDRSYRRPEASVEFLRSCGIVVESVQTMTTKEN